MEKLDEEELNKPINPLEYRPSFQKTEIEKTGWVTNVDEQEVITSAEEQETDIGNGLVTEIVEDFYDTKDKLEQFIQELEDKLKKEYVSYTPELNESVQKAKKELGLEGNELTILDYKEALEKSDTPAGDFLINLIENQVEDVNGSIQWEVYGDSVELSKELELSEKQLERLIFPIFDYEKEEEDWQEAFLQKEMEWNKQKESSDENKREKDSAYRKALLFNPEAVPATRNGLHQAEKTDNQFRFEFNHLENALLLIKSKRDEAEYMIGNMDYLLEKEMNNQEILSEIFSLSEDEEEKNESLTNVKLMLKLSVDTRNKEKEHYKNTLRNTYAISKQQKILDELAVQQELYLKQTLPMTHYLSGYQKEVSEETTDLFNELTLAMKKSISEREKYFYDSYLMNKASSNLRKEKLKQVELKDISRKGYQIANQEIERRRAD